MKATGVIRRIDDLGRVVIPKEIRRSTHIREGDPLEIYVTEDGGVMFRRYEYHTVDELKGYVDVIREQLQDQGASYGVQKEALDHLRALIAILKKDYRN